MKTLKLIAIAVLLLSGAAAGAQTMGVSDGHDLDALWAQAQKTLDVAREDAVILLDSRTTTVGDEGTVVTRVHQVVWIATSQGIRGYADLRVPWNSATSTFEVTKLRTWMGGRWWPDAEKISDTAVVETLPYAVATADDYTMLRETMLLHDGVELPCIMETDYTIAVQGLPTAGADGLFVFPQRDPVVRSEYVVRVPVGVDVKFESLNGAPQPVVTGNGVQELVWAMDGAGALKRPVTEQPEAYEPAVIWTTWESWGALLGEFNAAVATAAVLDEALADSVAAVVRGVPEGIDRVAAVLDFANRSVRTVHTDFLPWRLTPRPAVRTFATGYGHALDRAILVAALLAEPGVGSPAPSIVLKLSGGIQVAPGLPRFADIRRVRVRMIYFDGYWDVDGETGDLFDPHSRQGGIEVTVASQQLVNSPSPRYELDVSLDPAEGTWSGSGSVYVQGPAIADANLALAERPFEKSIEGLIAPVLPGATVVWANPRVFSGGHMVQARFRFELPAPAPDEEGRHSLLIHPFIGDSGYPLPDGIEIGDSDRKSPIVPAPTGHSLIVVRIRTDDHSVVWTPQPIDMVNDTGRFVMSAAQDQGWLTFTREAALGRESGKAILPAAAWPDLRALLLEELDPANGTIVLEKKK